MKPIILVGGGGHCKSVIDAAESAGYTIFGILDVAENVGKEILGYKVIGTDDDVSKYVGDCDFIVTVGHIKSSEVRRRIVCCIEEVGGVLATVVASTAHVSGHTVLGAGSVVLHGAMVNAGANIGRNCIINTLANVEHDAVIGDFCHVSTGVMVNGNCRVENGVFLGSQSVMLNGVSVADGCVVSAGSFVRKSIVERGIYAGNPAKLMVKL